MATASFILLKTIEKMFGLKNHAFMNEIREVRTALIIFAVCYTIRVIRNSLFVYFWEPCFTVHRDLLTNFVNTIFYFISDWFAIFAMLNVHHKNFNTKPELEKSASKADEITNTEQENFTHREEAISRLSPASSKNSLNSSSREGS